MTSPSEPPTARPATFDEWLQALREQASFFTGLRLDVGVPRWQLADDPSHRLVCEGCGAVQLVPRVRFDDVRGQVEAEFGFAIAFGHFAMTGRCAACR